MKKSSLTVRHSVDVPAHKMWETISAIGGVDVWFSSLIKSCEVIGEGVGATRICRTEAGPINERIEAIDHDNRIFRYSISEQNLLPVDNFLGTMKVEEEGAGSAVVWTAEFTVAAAAEAEVHTNIHQLYVTGVEGIANLHRLQAA
ncbi:MAG: SRPBCC family protein [Bacteroidota bacterium]